MKRDEDYLTPREIMELYPELERCYGWDERILGVLFRACDLSGRHYSGDRRTYISMKSLKRLISWINEERKLREVDPNTI